MFIANANGNVFATHRGVTALSKLTIHIPSKS